jgi:hypothetical protein
MDEELPMPPPAPDREGHDDESRDEPHALLSGLQAAPGIAKVQASV